MRDPRSVGQILLFPAQEGAGGADLFGGDAGFIHGVWREVDNSFVDLGPEVAYSVINLDDSRRPVMSDDALACPLAILCAEAAELVARKDAADAAGRAEREGAGFALDELSLSLDHIAMRASDHAPRSDLGALFALACAAGEVEHLARAAEPSPDAIRRLRRHLYGAAAHLARQTPLPPRIATFWLPPWLDPHAAMRKTYGGTGEG